MTTKGFSPPGTGRLTQGPGMDCRDSLPTGFSGNGQPGVPPIGTYLPASPARKEFAGGAGGGCVLNGPFVNPTPSVGPGDILTYNPH